MTAQFDVIWIGTGQATMSIVPRILAEGKSVAIIEGGDFGGTCVNTGCTPTKTLVAAARAIYQASRGETFGFSVDNLQIDFEKIMAPQKNNRQRATKGIEKRLASHESCQVFKGYAAFVDAHSIRVNDDVLTGEHIVINVGTRPRAPDVKGIQNIAWLNNEKLLDLNELPEHLAIVGGSYISLEFAQIFRRLGSKVSILERGDRLVIREDEDVSAIVDDVMHSEGIDIIYNSAVQSLTQNENITIDYLVNDVEPQQLKATHILFAIGRESNADLLALDKADLVVSKHGFIDVNECMQTNHAHIYAIGDVNGKGAFTHTAVNDGEIFWDHYSRLIGVNQELPALDRRFSMRTQVYSMFIDPPLARIGLSEAQARQSDSNLWMATLPMKRISRAVEKQETKGIVKIIVDIDSEAIVGATVFGTGADEVIAAFAPVVHAKMSYKLFRRTVFPHPTVAELLPWILDNLAPLKPV